jgi:hypothetical protein
MQGTKRRECLFHSQDLQRSRHPNTLQAFGLGLFLVHPGVVSSVRAALLPLTAGMSQAVASRLL